MKTRSEFDTHLDAIALTLCCVLWAVLFAGCGTMTSKRPDKFAFAKGIPEPDVPAQIVRDANLNISQEYLGREITVVFIVEADGFVSHAAASAADPRSGEAAVQTVRRFAFQPALLDGMPIRSVECISWVYTKDNMPNPSITYVAKEWKDAREFLDTRR